ncbi:phosphatase regulator subunit [Babesia ovata]|uniref:Phosphatase regulator subunit n=1 Tax=Babesia ovata TaxID=189622 RepID=A0A2H6KF71_9APIC|nr:phosphatase regulator subunit [Babesia ovata]GBE61635.1 phosphatase regulator subunit [Babesia ovata]
MSQAENIGSLVGLELLELGSNRIREYDEIQLLPRLKSLWLGRNKITHMRLPPLPHLTTCSLQNNRICEWAPEIASSCPELQELYLSFNRLTEIPPLINRMRKLSILDLGNNDISRINIDEPNDCVEELWLNDNSIEDERDIEPLKLFRRLKVLYLERNPIQAKLGPGYRNRVLHILPLESAGRHARAKLRNSYVERLPRSRAAAQTPRAHQTAASRQYPVPGRSTDGPFGDYFTRLVNSSPKPRVLRSAAHPVAIHLLKLAHSAAYR